MFWDPNIFKQIRKFLKGVSVTESVINQLQSDANSVFDSSGGHGIVKRIQSASTSGISYLSNGPSRR